MVDIPSFQQASDVMHHRTGVVIPVYFPEDVDRTLGAALLRDNVGLYCEQVADPKRICLTVDGKAHGEDVVAALASDLGVSMCVGEVNRGKLNGVGNGMKYLLSEYDLDFLTVVDQDGDHFGNELLNFVRTALHIGLERVLVLGNRVSRHMPMGLLRGELEELADRVLLDALSYYAVKTDRPLRLEYANVLDEFPDFHSGYKLFSRKSAEDVFLGEVQMAGCSETCYYRHACEAVMVVEALVNGGYLGVVNRRTLNEQPISTFGLYNRQELIADKMIWPCKRLDVPPHFVKQWLDNHIPRLLLGTMVPGGKEELGGIRKLVLEAFGVDGTGEGLKPLFV